MLLPALVLAIATEKIIAGETLVFYIADKFLQRMKTLITRFCSLSLNKG